MLSYFIMRGKVLKKLKIVLKKINFKNMWVYLGEGILEFIIELFRYCIKVFLFQNFKYVYLRERGKYRFFFNLQFKQLIYNDILNL